MLSNLFLGEDKCFEKNILLEVYMEIMMLIIHCLRLVPFLLFFEFVYENHQQTLFCNQTTGTFLLLAEIGALLLFI